MVKPYVKGLVLLAVLLSFSSIAFAEGISSEAHVAGMKNIAVGIACFAVAIGVGLVGFASASAVGRNPGASGEILKIGIIGMAFVEAIAFYVLFLL